VIIEQAQVATKMFSLDQDWSHSLNQEEECPSEKELPEGGLPFMMFDLRTY